MGCCMGAPGYHVRVRLCDHDVLRHARAAAGQRPERAPIVILRPVCDGIVAVRLPYGVGIGWARAGIVTVRLYLLCY